LLPVREALDQGNTSNGMTLPKTFVQIKLEEGKPSSLEVRHDAGSC
jgi:hypothetical protein